MSGLCYKEEKEKNSGIYTENVRYIFGQAGATVATRHSHSRIPVIQQPSP